MLECERCAMTGATCCDALTEEMVCNVSGPEVLDRTGRGGKGAPDPEAAGFWDDHGTAELGPVTGDAAGGWPDTPETLKGKPVCAGRPDRGPCSALTEVLMVGLGRYPPAELLAPLARLEVDAEDGDAEEDGA